MTEGIEEHTLEGIAIKIYGVAKTVTDCFKFRNKIGLDIALEALRETRRKKLCATDEMLIWEGGTVGSRIFTICIF